MANLKVVRPVPVENEYVLTLTKDEAEAIYHLVNFGQYCARGLAVGDGKNYGRSKVLDQARLNVFHTLFNAGFRSDYVERHPDRERRFTLTHE
jgi:hypothetical protein